MRSLIVALALSLLTLCGVTAARAQDGADPSVQDTIRSQIDAFQHDDGDRAYSYAAPNIRAIFPSADTFMEMVKRGYQPVYRPKSFKFGAFEQKPGGVTQRVEIVGPDGEYYTALYSLERQPDGTWKITGCSLVKSEGSSA
jgi:hypothetical protein